MALLVDVQSFAEDESELGIVCTCEVLSLIFGFLSPLERWLRPLLSAGLFGLNKLRQERTRNGQESGTSCTLCVLHKVYHSGFTEACSFCSAWPRRWDTNV